MKLFALTAAAAAAACSFAFHAPAAAQSLPLDQVNALEGLFGKNAGARRSGAKGVCAAGHFVGNTVGRNLSSASVFNGDKVPAILRFSIGGGSPKASDKGRSVRGLAFQFTGQGGELWQSANVSAPVFFVARPEQFAPFLQVRTPDPATGKPDPAKLKAFNDANPETLRQAAYLAKAPVPASYGAVNYWSTNAFIATNARGEKTTVRWQFEPVAGTLGLTDEQLKTMPDDFLADELRRRVASGPVVFDLKFQIAEAGDPVDDPTQVWPESRRLVPVGQLFVTQVEPGAGGACENITFNPTALPKGLEASNDPVLRARAAPYAVSLGRRVSEAPR
jgi:catalase